MYSVDEYLVNNSIQEYILSGFWIDENFALRLNTIKDSLVFSSGKTKDVTYF